MKFFKHKFKKCTVGEMALEMAIHDFSCSWHMNSHEFA